MERLIANLKATAAKRIKFLGRDYLIARMTLIKSGVLNGSQGPLFYPSEELAASVDAWNGMPILLNHPTAGSGRSPAVFNEFGLGTVYQAEVVGHALVAEGWFDIERCNNVAPGLILRIEQGQPVELSTGLKVAAEVSAGEFNGVEYTAIARNYRPDHLAILPTAVGACSVLDGCGVNNELSHEQIRSQLYSALRDRKPANEVDCYIVDVFSDYFIYEQGPDLYRLDYKVKDDQVELALAGSVRVEREVSYVVSNQSEKLNMLTQEQRSQIISGLVNNCDCWKEGTTVLEAMNDEALQATENTFKRMKEISEANQTLTAANAAQEKLLEAAKAGLKVGDAVYTLNADGTWAKTEKPAEKSKQLTENDLPASLREDLEFARNMKAEQRASLTSKILAVKDTPYTAEDLQEMTLPALNKLALAVIAKDASQTQPDRVGQFVLPDVSNVSQDDLLPNCEWSFPNPVAAN